MIKKLLLSLILISLLIAGGWSFFTSDRVLSEIQLSSSLERVEQSALEEVVNPYLGQSFWRVDLARVHADLLKLDWVYKASVKRSWPNKLVISLVEQNPVVRWGEDALLNQEGDVFYPHQIKPFQRLVVLNGDPLTSRHLLKQLILFKAFFKPFDWEITALSVEADGVWKIDFSSKQSILLPPDDWQGKLDRFMRAFPKTKPSLRKFAQVYDLRYSNGFVIKQKNQ